MLKIGAQQGWQCPVCNYVYSPMTPACYNCNRPDNEKYKLTTGTTCGKICVCKSNQIDTSGRCINCGGFPATFTTGGNS